VAGARVAAGDQVAVTGASGRFFLQGLAPGSHTLTAAAPCSLPTGPREVRVQAGFTTVAPDASAVRADVLADCAVDLFDLVRVALQFHTEAPFQPACADLDGNGSVDVGDLAAVSAAFGTGCPAPWAGLAAAPPELRGPGAATGAGSVLAYDGPGQPVAWELRLAGRPDAYVAPAGAVVAAVRAVTAGAEIVVAQPGGGGGYLGWVPWPPGDVQVLDAAVGSATGALLPGEVRARPWGGCDAGRCRTAWLPAAQR
jgi:hypothetical protein